MQWILQFVTHLLPHAVTLMMRTGILRTFRDHAFPACTCVSLSPTFSLNAWTMTPYFVPRLRSVILTSIAFFPPADDDEVGCGDTDEEAEAA